MTTPDATVNGFVMQADFFKFRDRGVIQTAWRSVYKEILRFILSTDLTLQPDVLSARQRWETAARTRSGQYLKLSHDVNVLSAARQRRALYFGWRTRSMAGIIITRGPDDEDDDVRRRGPCVSRHRGRPHSARGGRISAVRSVGSVRRNWDHSLPRQWRRARARECESPHNQATRFTIARRSPRAERMRPLRESLQVNSHGRPRPAVYMQTPAWNDWRSDSICRTNYIGDHECVDWPRRAGR